MTTVTNNEWERRAAVAPVMALLQSYESRIKQPHLMMTTFMARRLRDWVFGKSFIKVLEARPSFGAECRRVEEQCEAWKRDSSNSGHLPEYRLAYMRCLDSLVDLAESGDYQALEDAISTLAYLPSDAEAQENADKAIAKGEVPAPMPTLADLYTGAVSGDVGEDAPVEVVPPPKTAQQKVTQLEKARAAKRAGAGA